MGGGGGQEKVGQRCMKGLFKCFRILEGGF